MQTIVQTVQTSYAKIIARALLARRAARNVSLMLAATLMAFVPGMASAFTAPTAGDFGYDIYDIVVTKMLGGPIGFIGAIALIIWGATKVMTQWMITVLCVIAGTIIIKAEDLVVTLGLVV
jgi:5,10-methenyltetrahydromethanopterin hydrogenase